MNRCRLHYVLVGTWRGVLLFQYSVLYALCTMPLFSTLYCLRARSTRMTDPDECYPIENITLVYFKWQAKQSKGQR